MKAAKVANGGENAKVFKKLKNTNTKYKALHLNQRLRF
jgi:hypothetical protein